MTALDGLVDEMVEREKRIKYNISISSTGP